MFPMMVALYLYSKVVKIDMLFCEPGDDIKQFYNLSTICFTHGTLKDQSSRLSSLTDRGSAFLYSGFHKL